MAIACVRLFTFLPLLPLLSVPRLRLRIAPLTSFDALREYLRAIFNLLFCMTPRPSPRGWQIAVAPGRKAVCRNIVPISCQSVPSGGFASLPQRSNVG
jgi:hypothetical protein